MLSGLLLVGCGGSSTGGSSSATLKVSSILPTPLLPGNTATLYGVFPADVSALLDGQPVVTATVAGGLRLNLSPDLVAGDHPLVLTGSGQSLQTTLKVSPYLDGVALAGNQLNLTGGGWGTGTATVQLGTQALPVTAVTPHLLKLTLPRAAAYGSLPVQITVNGQTSQALSVTREAGSVQGRVTLPAASLGAQVVHAQQLPVQTSARLLVALKAASSWSLPRELSGLTQRDFEPALQVVRLTFGTEEQASEATEVLKNDAGVRSVSYDTPISLDGVEKVTVAAPRPALVALGASTVPTPSPDQWHLGLLNLHDAWQRTTGAGVVVAVVDTGILSSHPDLKGRVLPGYNFVDGTTDATDTYGHGTHVAGLIGANGQALGVAPGVSLLPVRVIRGTSGGSALDVARGILYAANLLADHPNPTPAAVINLSLGLDGSSPLIEQAVQQVMAAGVIVVVAAGNSAGALASPASVPGVISVGAVSGPKLTYVPGYSSWGEGLQVASYGGDLNQDQDQNGIPDGILSTDVNADGTPGYGLRNGTSMAAPLVTGIVALALANHTSPPLVPGLLEGTATDLYVPGYDLRTGHGLPTGRAVTLAAPRSYVVAFDGQQQLVGWTALQPDGSFLLGNLPPGETLTLMAATDADSDGQLGQLGEQLSDGLTVQLTSSTVQDIQLPALHAVVTPQPFSLTPHP